MHALPESGLTARPQRQDWENRPLSCSYSLQIIWIHQLPDPLLLVLDQFMSKEVEQLKSIDIKRSIRQWSEKYSLLYRNWVLARIYGNQKTLISHQHGVSIADYPDTKLEMYY